MCEEEEEEERTINSVIKALRMSHLTVREACKLGMLRDNQQLCDKLQFIIIIIICFCIKQRKPVTSERLT